MTTLKWALIGSFVVAIIAAAGGLYLAGASHQRNKTDLKNATDRLETIDTVKDLENEAENSSDDALADSISDVQ